MSKDFIDDLLEALSFSPDNIPLRLRIAASYLERKDYNQAEEQYLEVLKLHGEDIDAKLGLAKCYYKLKKIAAAEIILEELIKNDSDNIGYLELLCYCQLRENNIADAKDTYQEIINIDGLYQNADFDSRLRLSTVHKEENWYTDKDAVLFLKDTAINFSDVGGMDEVKNQLSLKMIKPLLHKELYEAYGKKMGGGILLYGPPGCGKTYIARAIAGEIDANFISIEIHDVLDMCMGNSEQNLHGIFEIARANTPCVICIDEIDVLGANRNDMNMFSSTITNQLLVELDGIDSDNDGILIVAATNMPWRIDLSLRRPGRFDSIIFTPPPDLPATIAIYKIILKDKPIDSIDYHALAKAAKEFSGADIKASVDIAIEEKLLQSFSDDIPRPLTTKDILKAIKGMKSITEEWFATAKNYALYANESGMYDALLAYLKCKK